MNDAPFVPSLRQSVLSSIERVLKGSFVEGSVAAVALEAAKYVLENIASNSQPPATEAPEDKAPVGPPHASRPLGVIRAAAGRRMSAQEALELLSVLEAIDGLDGVIPEEDQRVLSEPSTDGWDAPVSEEVLNARWDAILKRAR